MKTPPRTLLVLLLACIGAWGTSAWAQIGELPPPTAKTPAGDADSPGQQIRDGGGSPSGS